MSLFSKRLVLYFFTGLVAANILLGTLLTRRSVFALRQVMRERMLDISKTAAALLDGDELELLQKEDKDTEPYQKALGILKTCQEQIQLEYIYGIRDMGDGSFTFTIDPAVLEPGEFGSPVVATEALRKASLGIPSVDEKSYKDDWGRFYSAYSPVLDSKGGVAGIIAVDFSAEWYEQQIHHFVYIIIFVCALSLFGGAGIVLLITGRIRGRFSKLNSEMIKMTREVEELAEELRIREELGASALEQIGNEPYDNVYDGFEELDDRMQFVRRELRGFINEAHKQAYTDALCGVGNRNAWFDIIKRIDSSIAYGGGDEFVVIIRCSDEDEIKALFSRLDDKIKDKKICKAEKTVPVAVSKGFSVFQKDSDSSVNAVFRRADAAMYADKAAYYACHKDRRRMGRL